MAIGTKWLEPPRAATTSCRAGAQSISCRAGAKSTGVLSSTPSMATRIACPATPKAATTSCGGGYSTGPGSSSTNTLYGDAYSMSGHARGGDDRLYGGGTAAPGGAITNSLYGD